MLDAIGYLRISPDPDQSGASLATQRGAVTDLADRLGLHLIKIFTDDSVSASKVRHDKSQWVQGVVQHLSDQPLTWLLGTRHDRLGRRLSDLEDLHDHQQEYPGFKVYTVAEGDLFANPAWPFLAAQAKVESMATSLRLRRQKESRRAQGLDSSGGRRPFGFQPDRHTVVPAERDAYREAVARVLAGESTTRIAQDFNRRGTHPAAGGQWQSHMLRRVLRNPRYVGLLTHKGQIVGPAAWPGFIDRETYNALLQALVKTAQPRPEGHSVSLLGGVATCGRCGTSMTGARKSGSNGGSLMYRCDRGIGGCGQVSRQRTLVDQYVTQKVLFMLQQLPIASSRESARANLAELNKLERELEQRIWKLDEAYEHGNLATIDYCRIAGRIRQRIDTLHKQIGAARLHAETTLRADTAEARWDGWTKEERRIFIRSQLATVVVKPVGRCGRRPKGAGLRDDEIEIITRH
ncbi:recombinase family protein [Streptomyces atratus]|uniref:recombinase family protein n=1 Tax=Streptomyces atratus TaxID=1893 RepID=UPI00224D1BDA|nr:recombinase family protein [Streptomyces atratus]MCX5344411.1 recombinase family protein [Streptomyces atratus]